MDTMASWYGHKFRVSSKQVYSFKNLTVKASSETEDKDKNKQKIVSRKNAKPYEITMTIILDRRFGVAAPKKEALKICEEARTGCSDFFYFAGTKVVDCQFMLVEASVDKVEMLANGKWMTCEVKCTWKQCTRMGVANSGGDGGKSSKKGGTSSRKKKSRKKGSSGLKIAGTVGGSSGSSGSSGNSSASNYIKTRRNAASGSGKRTTGSKSTVRRTSTVRRRVGGGS